jgi:t-SNARE complex subunit (syntaxin)
MVLCNYAFRPLEISPHSRAELSLDNRVASLDICVASLRVRVDRKAERRQRDIRSANAGHLLVVVVFFVVFVFFVVVVVVVGVCGGGGVDAAIS